jgi:hypothetical protein
MNIKHYSNSKTGYKGIYFIKSRNKYSSTIMVNGVSTFLGYFINIDDAIATRNIASSIYHGEFATYISTSPEKL